MYRSYTISCSEPLLCQHSFLRLGSQPITRSRDRYLSHDALNLDLLGTSTAIHTRACPFTSHRYAEFLLPLLTPRPLRTHGSFFALPYAHDRFSGRCTNTYDHLTFVIVLYFPQYYFRAKVRDLRYFKTLGTADTKIISLSARSTAPCFLRWAPSQSVRSRTDIYLTTHSISISFAHLQPSTHVRVRHVARAECLFHPTPRRPNTWFTRALPYAHDDLRPVTNTYDHLTFVKYQLSSYYFRAKARDWRRCHTALVVRRAAFLALQHISLRLRSGGARR